MNWLQVKSGLLKIAVGVSGIAGTIAVFSPKWGSVTEGGVEAASAIIGGIAIIYSAFAPHLKAANGLTEAEATAALNAASLAKAKEISVVGP